MTLTTALSRKDGAAIARMISRVLIWEMQVMWFVVMGPTIPSKARFANYFFTFFLPSSKRSFPAL
jgi:hypothetical protein